MANDETSMVPEATGAVYDGRTLRDFEVCRKDDRIQLWFGDQQDSKVKPVGVNLGLGEAKVLAQTILARVGE